jgi:hypothetical protein
LLRLAYVNYLDGKTEFSAVIDRIKQLDAELAEIKLNMKSEDIGALDGGCCSLNVPFTPASSAHRLVALSRNREGIHP